MPPPCVSIRGMRSSAVPAPPAAPAPRPVSAPATIHPIGAVATCAAPGCTHPAPVDLDHLCGADPDPTARAWGCGGCYCPEHLWQDEHNCDGVADLSMHWPEPLPGGGEECDWCGEYWPCTTVRSDPDNPTAHAW